MDEPRQFTGVTPEAMECMKRNMRAKGIMPPEGSSGTIEHMGVSLSFSYVGPQQTLEFRILSKPPFIPDQLIWGFLDPVVEGCAEE